MNSGKKVIIQYIFHSGFALEIDDYFLVFDYFNPPGSDQSPGLTYEDIAEKISASKYPFVFVSHGHHDHFSPVIFDWRKKHTQLTFILSSEVAWKHVPLDAHTNSHYISMSPYEHVGKNGIMVSSFGSTDLGVSFLVEVDGLRIFHAGDLNWWHWEEDSTKEELEEEERKFKKEVSYLETERIDILFFPVDPRLGEHFWLGGAYMLEVFHPKLFVPMHFGEECDITKQFADKMKKYEVPIFEISKRGQKIQFEK